MESQRVNRSKLDLPPEQKLVRTELVRWPVRREWAALRSKVSARALPRTRLHPCGNLGSAIKRVPSRIRACDRQKRQRHHGFLVPSRVRACDLVSGFARACGTVPSRVRACDLA